jgi:uncharacterized protein with GYD domain
MALFVMLSRLSLHQPGDIHSLAELDQLLEERLADQFPDVERVASYVLLGKYDFLHIFKASEASTAAKIALLLHSLGMGSTQTLTAIPFEEFRTITEE